MDRNFIIIDNFLDDPDRARLDALSLDFDLIQESVPGARTSSALVGDHQTEVETKLKTILGGEIVWDWTQASFKFQSCQEGTETWIHKDSPEEGQGEWAGVLFLTPYPNHDSGTACYLSPDIAYQYFLAHGMDPETAPEDFNHGSIIDMGAGNVYNRLVLYRGKELYHSSILPGFGDTLETSRLTQTFFFDVK
tara:strand:+ start:80 stop:658 length:579 start_codon:yes stop_codon:yes gene_type:complete